MTLTRHTKQVVLENHILHCNTKIQDKQGCSGFDRDSLESHDFLKRLRNCEMNLLHKSAEKSKLIKYMSSTKHVSYIV